jgi:catechol 2,3-dioxygenase-like lactoylglutathione lyase family enzyme
VHKITIAGPQESGNDFPRIVAWADESAEDDMPNVTGILETAIYATDPKGTAAFYRELFGFDALLETDRLIAFDVAGRNVLLIFKAGATRDAFETPGGSIPGHGDGGPGHFAFSIEAADVSAWLERLEAKGVALESTVNWPQGAQSLYFRDPDNNLVELITRGFWRIY